jgi:type II secretory pathway pseudopilin PulG
MNGPGNTFYRRSFTLTELMVIVAIFGLLLTIALPNFVGFRTRVQRDACVNNLRQIKMAKEQWALDYDKDYNDTPNATDLNTYIKDGTSSLRCPSNSSATFGSSYNINNLGTNPDCKISNSHSI